MTLASEHPPDVVVLDLGLPDLHGVEVIHGLRGWTDVPIIVLSGRVGGGDKVAALDAGAEDVDGQSEVVHLTPTEWHLLEVLLRQPGKLLSQRYLLSQVWGAAYVNQPANLRLYIAQLRRKLEAQPSRPRHLLTEPGMGYRFQP